MAYNGPPPPPPPPGGPPEGQGGDQPSAPPPPWGGQQPPQQQWGHPPAQPQQPWGQAPYSAQPYAAPSAAPKKRPVALIIGCVVALLALMAACCGGASWYIGRQAGGMVGLTAVGWYYNIIQGGYDAAADITVGGRAEAERLGEQISTQFGRLTPTGQEMVGIKPRMSSDGRSAQVSIAANGSKGAGTLVIHLEQVAGTLWQVKDVSVEGFRAY